MNPNMNFNIGVITNQLHEHQKHINNLMLLWTNLRDNVNTLEINKSNLEAENFILKQENTLIKTKLNEILTEMGKETI